MVIISSAIINVNVWEFLFNFFVWISNVIHLCYYLRYRIKKIIIFYTFIYIIYLIINKKYLIKYLLILYYNLITTSNSHIII